MPMQNPPHPGEIVRWECLEPLGLTVTRAAEGLGVTRQTLSDLGEREGGYFGRDGPAPFSSLRLVSGDMDRDADRLRPLAGSGPSRANQSGEIRLANPGVANVAIFANRRL